MRSIFCDIESFSPVNLAKSGVYPYAAHPEFELLLFGYSMPVDPYRVHPQPRMPVHRRRLLRDRSPRHRLARRRSLHSPSLPGRQGPVLRDRVPDVRRPRRKTRRQRRAAPEREISSARLWFRGLRGCPRTHGRVADGARRTRTQAHRRRVAGSEPTHRSALGGRRAGRAGRDYHPPSRPTTQPRLHRGVGHPLRRAALGEAAGLCAAEAW